MRRLLAILLLCVFGLPIASPLFAAAADQDAGLPACCRRNGAHHCSRNGLPTSGSQAVQITALHEKCPAYPAATTVVRHNDVSLLTASPLSSHHPARAVDILPLAVRIPSAVDRSRHERGPPSLRG